jgi:hypothetical protein
MASFAIENLPREVQIVSKHGNIWFVIDNGHIQIISLGDGPGPNDPSPLRALEATAKALEIAIPQIQKQWQGQARH